MLSDDQRRSPRSSRDRSAKGIREPPQVYVISLVVFNAEISR